MAKTALCLNCGSSSLKFSVFELDGDTLHRQGEGAVQGIGGESSHAFIRAGERKVERAGRTEDQSAALESAFDLLNQMHLPAPTVVGHRVVHGGRSYAAPVLIDDAVLNALKEMIPLAPLHLPASLAAIEASRARFRTLPQVACFDTAFHRGMPEVARRLPIPDALHRDGVERYGFHGLSYEYIMSVLGPSRPAQVVIAHLGAGASLVAVKDGVSVDTTMGFTPTGGVVMATRSGDLDPGLLLYLARERGYSTDALADLVEKKSGLVALGGTADMKTLLERAPTDAGARLAVSVFAYSVRKAIGALAAAQGGLDLLVFTGGIGEHAAPVRAEACAGLKWLGVSLDPEKNDKDAPTISDDSSRCPVRVIPTDEDAVIARHAFEIAQKS